MWFRLLLSTHCLPSIACTNATETSRYLENMNNSFPVHGLVSWTDDTSQTHQWPARHQLVQKLLQQLFAFQPLYTLHRCVLTSLEFVLHELIGASFGSIRAVWTYLHTAVHKRYLRIISVTFLLAKRRTVHEAAGCSTRKSICSGGRHLNGNLLKPRCKKKNKMTSWRD